MKKLISLPNISKLKPIYMRRIVSINAMELTTPSADSIILNNASIPQIVTCMSGKRFTSIDKDLAICLVTPPDLFEEKILDEAKLAISNRKMNIFHLKHNITNSNFIN